MPPRERAPRNARAARTPPPRRRPLQDRTESLRNAKNTLSAARPGQQENENVPAQGALPDGGLINAAVAGLTNNLDGIKTHLTGLGVEVEKVTNASNNQLSTRLDGIINTLDLVTDQVIEFPQDMDDKVSASQATLTIAMTDFKTEMSNKMDDNTRKLLAEFKNIVKNEVRKELQKARRKDRNLDEDYGLNKKIDGPRNPQAIDSMSVGECQVVCRLLLDTAQPQEEASRPAVLQWWRNRVRHVYGYIDDDNQEGGMETVDSEEEEEEE
ncbi:hypothetical protein BELL_1445g00010 [Botrytis elliptica]|uniref:Uncharacterized protein n=1 Tax=Botrytis elliptica TaxID=278938 RepID=A0A4Z1I2T6_9HELO|nr:hypothetical protein BELL_1445g00010 [Botrytis elliptica]